MILHDLKTLGVDADAVAHAEPSDFSLAARAMIGCGYYLAAFYPPVAFLGEILVIEGLSQKRAHYFTELIQKTLHLPNEAMTFLKSHGELDQGHLHELEDVVRKFVRTEEDLKKVLEVIHLIYPLYIQMLKEIDTSKAFERRLLRNLPRRLAFALIRSLARLVSPAFSGA